MKFFILNIICFFFGHKYGRWSYLGRHSPESGESFFIQHCTRCGHTNLSFNKPNNYEQHREKEYREYMEELFNGLR